MRLPLILHKPKLDLQSLPEKNDADGFAQQVIFDLVHSQRCPSHSAGGGGGGASARSMPQTPLLLQMISFLFFFVAVAGCILWSSQKNADSPRPELLMVTVENTHTPTRGNYRGGENSK